MFSWLLEWFIRYSSMETLQMQIILSGLQGSSSIIPDVIPDEKKPLDPPWVVEYDDEDHDEDYDDDYEE